MPNPVQVNEIRLLVGDTSQDLPYLADETYEWILDMYGGSNYLLNSACEALEMIINQIALSPQSVKTEEITEIGPLVSALEGRLVSLKAKRDAAAAQYGFGKTFPMMIKSDRKNWNDFDELFGKNT